MGRRQARPAGRSRPPGRPRRRAGAAVAVEQREGRQPANHVRRLGGGHRREPDGHVAEQLDRRASRRACDERAEQRVDGDPGEQLDAAGRDLPLDEKAVGASCRAGAGGATCSALPRAPAPRPRGRSARRRARSCGRCPRRSPSARPCPPSRAAARPGRGGARCRARLDERQPPKPRAAGGLACHRASARRSPPRRRAVRLPLPGRAPRGHLRLVVGRRAPLGEPGGARERPGGALGVAEPRRTAGALAAVRSHRRRSSRPGAPSLARTSSMACADLGGARGQRRREDRDRARRPRRSRPAP